MFDRSTSNRKSGHSRESGNPQAGTRSSAFAEDWFPGATAPGTLIPMGGPRAGDRQERGGVREKTRKIIRTKPVCCWKHRMAIAKRT